MQHSFRDAFDIPADVAYFNSASLGPPLTAVAEAGRSAIDRCTERWKIGTADWFGRPEQLRAEFAQLVGTPTDSVALVPSASYGIAVAARNIPLGRGDTIVIVAEQYPSNVYAWRRRAAETGATIITVDKQPTVPLTDAVLRAIDSKTGLVAIPNCHWTDGELIDVVAVSDAARSAGAALVIDASQSLGIRPIDFDVVQPDFVVCVGYKWLLGPYGLSYLVASDHWCEHGVPIEETWVARRGSENFAELVNYTDFYRDGARRFDCGEFSQFINVPMATAAVSQLNAWGRDTIQAAFAERAERVRAIAASVGLDVRPRERSVEHIIGVALPDIATAESLAKDLAAANVFAGVRGSNLRIASHLHSNDADFERLDKALRESFD
ncbi:MAG: aminotransferase class V-fold PLP-dependent enzyme [Pseudomonadota bacterium]